MTKDETTVVMLPRLMRQLELLNSESMTEYEHKLQETTEKALDLLRRNIEDESLALDPESLVESVKVLTNAQHIINEDKRKLLETTLRGTAMLKAINDNNEKEKNTNNDNKTLLEKFFATQLPSGMTVEDTKINSVFNVEDEIINDSGDTESSSDD